MTASGVLNVDALLHMTTAHDYKYSNTAIHTLSDYSSTHTSGEIRRAGGTSHHFPLSLHLEVGPLNAVRRSGAAL